MPSLIYNLQATNSKGFASFIFTSSRAKKIQDKNSRKCRFIIFEAANEKFSVMHLGPDGKTLNIIHA